MAKFAKKAAVVRYRTKVVQAARRTGSRVASAANAERHTLAAVGAAAALGFLKRSKVDLPKIDAIGTPGTYGLALWMFARFTKSRIAGHMATGLLCLSAYEFAQNLGVPGSTMSGDDMGDGEMSGAVDCGDYGNEGE